eukprot:TRINITY_DN61630_c0_g1_i1.p1 TRINITY_DN61630_c0_g1~~TRINITY_DN61630_c0_g1_i1.p1  ORF type:complete len:730 (+),score=171.16 TRINITY_DN61630_c0_g1_i1:47-2236(+)
MEDLLRQFGGSRLCFAGPGAARVDATVVCHDLRNIRLASGERIWISLRVLESPERDIFGLPGESIQLKSLKLDATILLRTWAAGAQASPQAGGDRRACGELHIPVHRLVSRFSSCLYYTWVLLDSPGLSDSVASVGLLADGAENEAFDQAIMNAPRQLFQPKACLTLIRTSDLPTSGQIAWMEDVANAHRTAFWAPLLRSQRQHVLLCQAMFLQDRSKNPEANADVGDSGQTGGANQEKLEAELRMLRKSHAERQEEVGRLRNALMKLEDEAQHQGGGGDDRAGSRHEHHVVEELATLKAENCQLKADLKMIRETKDEESRHLRREVDDVAKERENLLSENQVLTRAIKGMSSAQPVVKEADGLREEVARLREGMSKAEARVRELEDIVHEKSLLMAKERTQLRNAEANLRVQGTRELELKEKAERLQSKVSQLEASGSALAHLEAELETTRREATAFREEVAGKQLEDSRRFAAHDRNEADMQVLRRELAMAREEVRSLKDDLADNARELERLKSEKARLAAKLEEQGDRSGTELDSLRSQLAKYKEMELRDAAEIDKLLNQLAKCKEREAQDACELDQTRAMLANNQAASCESSAALQTCDRLRAELDTLRQTEERQRAELTSLKRELDLICEEGSTKMGAASEQVRAIQRGHEEALREISNLKAERSQLADRLSGLESERDALAEQKDALAQIVEDLHSSLLDQGSATLTDAGRQSIDAIFKGRPF